LSLGLDFGYVNEEIRRQNEQLARARSFSPEVDDCIRRLESSLMLTDEENGVLIKKIGEALKDVG